MRSWVWLGRSSGACDGRRTSYVSEVGSSINSPCDKIRFNSSASIPALNPSSVISLSGVPFPMHVIATIAVSSFCWATAQSFAVSWHKFSPKAHAASLSSSSPSSDGSAALSSCPVPTVAPSLLPHPSVSITATSCIEPGSNNCLPSLVIGRACNTKPGSS